jgi:hypothetical protein
MLLYLFLYLFSFTLLFLVGHCVLLLFSTNKESNFSTLFFKLFIGLVGSISLFSTLKTNGLTINTGLLFIAFLYILITKQKLNFTNYFQRIKLTKVDYIQVSSLIILSSCVFFWKYYCLFNNNQEFPIVINSDSIFHSNISIFLNSVGVESLNTNYYYPPDGTHPYHYFEGWTIAFFSFIFNLNAWITEEIIVYPLYALLIISGIWSLIEKITPLTLFSKIASISVLFFSSFYIANLSQFGSVFNLKDTHCFNFNAIDEFWGLKLAVAYIFSLAGINLLIDKKIIPSTLLLLALPIVSITLAPGIFMATSLLLFTLFIFRKKIKLDSTISFYQVGIPILIFLFIILFYRFSGASQEYIATPSKADFLNEFNSISAIKNKISFFIYRILQIIVLYAPVWILFLVSYFSNKLNWKNKLSQLSLLFYFIVFLVNSSLIVWLLLSFGFGSKAYFFYASLPFINIFSVLLLIISQELTNSKTIKWSIRFFILLTFSIFAFRSYSIYTENKKKLWDIYSVEYLKKVFLISKKIENKKGLKIEGGKSYDSPIVIDNINTLSPFLSGFTNKYNENFSLISLSSLDITKKQLKNTINKNYVLLTPINLYKKQLISNNKFYSNQKTKLSFILKHKIEYIFLNKNENLDPIIKPFVKRKIIDPKSGTSFILIKKI